MEIMIEYISERGRMAQGMETEFQRLKRAASESRKTTTTKSPNKCKKKKKKEKKDAIIHVSNKQNMNSCLFDF